MVGDRTLKITLINLLVHRLEPWWLFWKSARSVSRSENSLILVSSLAVGRIGDIIGRRRTIWYGALIFVVGGVFQTCAWSMWVMILGRIISGVGVGLLSYLILRELLTSGRLCQSINLRFHHLIIGGNWLALSLQGTLWDMHRVFGWIISAVIYQVIGHGGHHYLCSVLQVHF
jgi:MFS family permease